MKLKFGFYALATVLCSLMVASNSAFGSDQISVVVNGTSYICSGSGSVVDGCSGAIAGLKSAVESCVNGHSDYSPQCMNQQWPRFKNANPSCAYEAISICVDYCANGHSDYRPSCTNFCSN